MNTTWIVGDVHGCGAELEELLERLGPGAGDRVILTGDLFDKGPDPVQVLDLLREVGAEAVLGNHDVAVRDHGGARLGTAAPPARPPAPYLVTCLDRLAAAGRLEEAVELCAGLPRYIRGDGFLVVHGGFDPGRGPEGTSERLATTVREFPPGVPGAPKWWTLWPGPEVAVFGHDARQGLVRHAVDGRLRCIGLDSGLVYGGKLTAWSPERDVSVQVRARRAHAVPGLPRPPVR
jgi:bis(5'-nucleosyl)-tetraphosphatase (symmetrical)